jgi:hypothetical protein
MVWTELNWLRIHRSGGSCEHGNEHSASIKYREFTEWLNECWLLKQASAPWSQSNKVHYYFFYHLDNYSNIKTQRGTLVLINTKNNLKTESRNERQQNIGIVFHKSSVNEK